MSILQDKMYRTNKCVPLRIQALESNPRLVIMVIAQLNVQPTRMLPLHPQTVYKFSLMPWGQTEDRDTRGS